MKAILSNFRIGSRNKTASTASTQHWRNVPRVNLLAKPKDGYSNKTLLRVALVVIIVLGIYVSLSRYLQLQDFETRTRDANSQFASLQGTVSTKQDELNRLKEQVNQLRQQQDTVKQAYEALKSGKMNWGVALPAIFDNQVTGVALTGVTSKGADKLEIQGIASDQAAIAKFQSALVNMSSTLELQNMNVSLREGSYQFVAQVALKKE